ncbi:MAG: arginine--tRNA ligase, partial [Verrucomicrobiota bacterium]|nr:arginine--tRNA ligase [Verrucomicrobiota bacterium]
GANSFRCAPAAGGHLSSYERDAMNNEMLTGVLENWLRAAFQTVATSSGAEPGNVTVVETTDPQFGDYQCNAAMALGKTLKQPPRKIAEAVVRSAAPPARVEKIEVAGPGFINLRLKTAWLGEYVQDMARTERLGIPLPGQGKTVVLDYSGPNIAKSMHIGHIRSTIIGNALDRMHRALGYRVIADNHLGDWGTQFGILIAGYRRFADSTSPAESPVEKLERIYVRSCAEAEADPAWLDQCRRELVKLQSGDAENLALWKQFVALSLSEFDRVYRRLGVSFDLVRGESHYNDRLPGVVERLEKEELARPSEGATVVFLEEEKLPVCIVRKKDGGFNYATTDIATVLSRIEEFDPDRIVYVTDERQQLHFRQLFAVCRRLGIRTKLEHVWFGLMRLPEGAFATRQGNVIKLEALLDEAERRALAVVRQASPEMPPDQQQEVARAVGIGAVKYADLSQNPQTLVTFTWEKALALDGNSAPYLQYAYARIASVQDKYRERFPGRNPEDFPIALGEPLERALALKAARFPECVLRAAELHRPSALTDYLYDLAQTYSAFYQKAPFLKAPNSVRESRVRLCGVVARVLKKGLDLLGIETPERI